MKYKDPITGKYKELFLKASDTLPIGAIVPYGSDDIPTNWLLCDGSAVSRTTYANLFSVIGTKFGEGDGETTFNLPDFRSIVQPSLVTNYIIKAGMSVGVLGNVVNEKTNSSKDTYSCEYIENFVNESLLEKYTEDEVRVGTWFGKPYYRKIITVTNLTISDGVTLKHGISNIDEVLPMTRGSMKASGSSYQYHYPLVSRNGNIADFVVGKDDIMWIGNDNWASSNSHKIVIYYTKTTDIVEE